MVIRSTVRCRIAHGEEALWHVNAIDLRRRGRGLRHEAITGTGPTELEAVRALTDMLPDRASR